MRELKESMPDDARNNCWWTRSRKDFPYQMKCKKTVDGRDRWRNRYQMMYETTVDGSDQSRTFHTRWCAKQLLTDETDEEYHSRCTKQLWMEEAHERIHTRWCTKQLLMDVANEGLPISDDVQTTVDGRENGRSPCQMMYEKAVDGWVQRRTYHTRWCTKQLLMDETDKEMHTRCCMKQLLMDETNERLPIPVDVQHNRLWMRQNMECIPDEVWKSCK